MTNKARFSAFHAEHPEVYDLFVHFTYSRIYAGFDHYSAYAIMNRVRWETDAGDNEFEDGFKINNNHIPFYARMFADHHPEHGDFFRMREQWVA